MNDKKQTLFVTLVSSIVFSVILIMSLYSFYNYVQIKDSVYKEIEIDSNSILNQLEKILPHFIDSYAINEYENLLKEEMNNKNFLAIIVKDYNLGEIAGRDFVYRGKIRDKNWNSIEYDNENELHKNRLSQNILVEVRDIYSNSNKKIAEVALYSSDYNLKNELSAFVEKSFFEILILSIVLVFILFAVIKSFILSPLFNIIEMLNNSDENGLPKNLLPSQTSKELSSLSNTINTMINSVKESKAKLKESEFRWKFAIEGNKDGLWDWNVNTSEVFYSKQWKNMLGYEENEIEGKLEEWESRVHPEDLEKVNKDINEYLEGKSQLYNSRHRVRCKDGSYKWVLDRGVIVQRDKDGNPLRLIGTNTDISKQVESEREIEAQKKEFETVFNYSKDGIAILDLDTNFLKFNKAYLDMTGFSKEELLQTSCKELTAPEDVERVEEALKHVLEHGYIESFEKTCIIKGEKRVSVNISISLLPDKQRLLIVTKDISSTKLMQEQSRLASMGEMIGNIAHQWRQPLSVITTSASGLKLQSELEMITQKEISESVDNIIDQANYLSKTIDSFRDYIKGDKAYSKVSIKDMVENSLNLVSASLKNNYVNLIIDMQEDMQVNGNKNELSEAIINIINNSKDVLKTEIKNEDDRLLFVSTKKIDENTLELTILDSGNGIQESIISRIFEPYFTTKHKSQGTGLGLSMVDKILRERHKAKVSVYNKEYKYNEKTYKGACFSIIFLKEV